MFRTFDIIITVCLAVFIVMLLTGHGEQLMNLFSGGRNTDVYKEYDRTKFDRACLVFCTVLLIDELVLIFLSKQYPVLGLVSVGVTIAAFAGYVYYIKKYARK